MRRIASVVLSLFIQAFILDACGDPGVTYKQPDDMATQETYTAKGLWTYPSNFGEIPDGAFSRADEAVIRREGIIQTRRGFKAAPGTLGAAGDRFDALHDFNGTLVGHTTADAVATYDGSAWTALSGTFTPPTGARTHFLKTGKSLYFTTDAGVKRLDAVGGTVYDAGIPQALGGSVAVSVPAGSGWFPDSTQTAYRLVWGLRNANDRIILGAPSGRMPLTNTAGAARDVTLTVPIPSWVTSEHFLQVYRADTSASASIPASDDMGLVMEVYPTAPELTARSMTLVDISPDELKGAPLYSSPNLGVPGSEKFQPPVCTDLADYKGRMWCLTTTQRQRLALTLLSTDAASGGLIQFAGISLRLGNTRETYRAAAAESVVNKEFQLFTAGTASANIANTAQSFVRIVNAASAFANAYYVSGEYDSPGQIIIEAKALGASPIEVTTELRPQAWAPALRTEFPVIAGNVTRAGSTVTVALTGFAALAGHGLSVGDEVVITEWTNPADQTLFPAGVKVVTAVPTGSTFEYTEAGTAGSNAGEMSYAYNVPAITTDPTSAPNGLAYSEFEEPDAVPLGNYLSVGAPNYKGQRVIRLGDTLFVFKEDGIYTVNGDTPETFAAREFPTPAKILAPETAQLLGNSIYVLTDQGVMSISESGASIISRPIEGTLKALYAGGSALHATVEAVAFGVSYETEREYWLFMPSSSSDTHATQVFVYNYITKAWTRWADVQAYSGYVLPTADVAYLGWHNVNRVRVERKTLTTADYQDADGVPITMAVDWQVRLGDGPAGYKHWQKVTVMVEQPAPTAVDLSIGTEVASTRASGTMTLNGLPYVTSYVPVDQSRSQTLTVGLSGGQAETLLALKGLSVNVLTPSTKLR